MEANPINPALMTIKQAAAYLAINSRTLFNLSREGRILAVRIGSRCVRYERSELDRFIKQCRGEA